MGMSEATVVCWHKDEGDYIEEGEALVQIETSKSTEEIGAPVTGVVSKLFYQAGEVVEVGRVLAIITAARAHQ
jgi:pyruvate/2-oxoglutarate dehydrogenase complex dihydrolipoamide acyltransferase (E2) component